MCGTVYQGNFFFIRDYKILKRLNFRVFKYNMTNKQRKMLNYKILIIYCLSRSVKTLKIQKLY